MTEYTIFIDYGLEMSKAGLFPQIFDQDSQAQQLGSGEDGQNKRFQKNG